MLAGGASRRMGRDKATLPHPAGRTMVERTVEVLVGRCDPVFVVAAPGQPMPALPGAEVLRDEVRGVGPLLATGRGLRAAAAAGADWAFVCACDMPGLSAALIDELARHATGDPGMDVVLPWDGGDHYLAGLYRTGLATRIESLIGAGERSMRALSDTVLTQRVVLPAGLRPAVANVNTPDDLA